MTDENVNARGVTVDYSGAEENERTSVAELKKRAREQNDRLLRRI